MMIEIQDFLGDGKRRGMSPRTIEWHRQVLAWFAEWAETKGVTSVDQVTRSVVRAYGLPSDQEGDM